MRMEIEFKDERELVKEMVGCEVNVYTLATLLLDEFGITLNQRAQDKLLHAQNKRENERTLFKTWKMRHEVVYTQLDVLTSEVRFPKPCSKSVAELIFDMVGELKPGSFWAKDFFLYQGKYYFSAAGFESFMFSLARRGYITDEQYNQWKSGFDASK